jgi:PTH1 family peptidyl-tRNA hydrolase
LKGSIKLIVGIGNPGAEYQDTRHNAGVWFVELLANHWQQNFHNEKKFKGRIATVKIGDIESWLVIPTTYMNLSGQAVNAIAKFYKLIPEEILIVHDELDFEPGIIRLKHSGGSGGHNGLKDIIAQLGSANFYRLRIGIGHPGNRDQVLDYVLHKPSANDNELIRQAMEKTLPLIPDLVQGQISKVTQKLHSDH